MTAVVAGLMAATGGASASTAAPPTIGLSPARAIASPHGATVTYRAMPSAAPASIHPDVSLAPNGTFADAVVNPASTKAYLTAPGLNEVFVLNLSTLTYGRPIRVGSIPQGIDITPDGKTLYVCDSGGQTISRVDIATRKVTTIITPKGFENDTPFSIAVMNNGHAIYTTTFNGSGFAAFAYNLNLRTGVSTRATGLGIDNEVTEDSPVSRSGDHATVGLVIGDDSGGTFDVYTAATGRVVSGSLNDFISSSALNGNGSTMLVSGNSGTYVIDPATGARLGTIACANGNSVLNASGSTGYCVLAQSVVRLHVKTFLTGGTISLPEPTTPGALPALSPNGRYLVIESNGGATVVKF
jgi:YVTN family beta-propeller protein